MDKRYQVFISSTYEDLKEERAEVIQALLELDCIPAGMEMFPAANDDQWTLIKRVIDESDYYLLIVGGRYGCENTDGISYTQMEYEYAQSIGKPTIAFLPKNPDNIPQGKTDMDSDKLEKLNSFKKTVESKMVKYWESSVDLGSLVSRSMIKLIKNEPAEGWVRANSAIDETSVKEISRLQKEIESLRSQIAGVSTSAPKGTEELSQGNNFFEIDFEGYCYIENNYYSHIKLNYSCRFTWNEIFETVAPEMISECNEGNLKHSLDEMIMRKPDSFVLNEDLLDEPVVEVESAYIKNYSFNKIMVQLKALGLICLSEKKRAASDTSTYWKLTPYGDYYMTRLMAIQK